MTIKINGTNTTAQPSITGADTDTGLVYGTDEVQVVTGGTTRATVDSSGNIGIGRTSPAQNLDVASTNNIAYALDGWALAGKGDSSDILLGGILGSQFDTLKVYTSGSEKLRIQSGGGISFNGDTAAANALDDYEEGTWTPVLTGSTTNPSYSGSQEGKYTKIGDMVTCWGFIDTNPVTSSGSGNIAIGGLPYPNSGLSTASAFGSHIAVYGPSFNGTLSSRITTGASAITIFQVVSNTALTAWTFSGSGWASGDAIYFQVSYKV